MDSPLSPGFTASGRWTFLLLTPDAVRARMVERVLQLVGEYGLRPVVALIAELDPGVMRRLYVESRVLAGAHGVAADLPSVDVFRQWYSLGPACIVPLVSVDGDAAGLLLRAKGRTDPAEASPGTIRFLGENALTNLAHCPDDTVSAVRELEALVGGPRAKTMFAMDDSSVAGHLSLELLPGALPVYEGMHATSVPCILNRLRRRILMECSVAQTLDLHRLRDVASALLAEARELQRCGSSQERYRLSVQYDESSAAAIAELAALHGPTMQAVAEGVSRTLRRVGEPSSDFHRSLAESPIYVSDLERTLLSLDASVWRKPF